METSIFSPSALNKRRQKCAQSLLSCLQPGEAILIPSGSPITKPGGLDQTYPFLPLPEYFWLTGSRRSGEAILFTPDEGWKIFRRPVSQEEMIWEGEIECAQEDLNIADLKPWLEKKNLSTIFHFPVFGLQELIGDLSSTRVAPSPLIEAINQCRRPKDEEEIRLVRKCAGAAARGYSLLKELVQNGVTEKSLQIAYEAEVLKAGADKFPYDSIFGAGSRSAILHALPTERKLQNGEILLVLRGHNTNLRGWRTSYRSTT
jgi:Xaa-Pro dipeptidase